jgi:hypothetical protein
MIGELRIAARFRGLHLVGNAIDIALVGEVSWAGRRRYDAPALNLPTTVEGALVLFVIDRSPVM